MTFKELMDGQSDGEVASQQRAHRRDERAHEMAPVDLHVPLAPQVEKVLWKRARQQKREQQRIAEQKAELYSLQSIARVKGDLSRIRFSK